MSEMRERIARALGGLEECGPYGTINRILEAIREPTPDMLRAACAEARKEQLRPVEIRLSDAELLWQAMIDAARTK